MHTHTSAQPNVCHAQVFNWEKKHGDGTPKVRWVPVDEEEVRQYLDRSITAPDLGEEGIHGRDLHRIDGLQDYANGACRRLQALCLVCLLVPKGLHASLPRRRAVRL